jgi:hypothetical protein
MSKENQDASGNDYNVKSYVVTLVLSSGAPNYMDCLSRINLSTWYVDENRIGVKITWPDAPDRVEQEVTSGDTIDLGRIGRLGYAVQFTNVSGNGEESFWAETAIVGQNPDWEASRPIP